jgi:hypothetical protein
MKYSKTLAILATFILVASSANAQNMPWGHTSIHSLEGSDEPASALFTINSYTDHDYKAQFSIQNFSGTSTSDPCSDLQPFGEPVKYNLLVEEVDIDFDNPDIIRHWGAAKTCIKSEISVNGVVFSTGNIQLAWDENANAYTSATPSSIDMDFSEGDVGGGTDSGGDSQ